MERVVSGPGLASIFEYLCTIALPEKVRIPLLFCGLVSLRTLKLPAADPTAAARP